MKKLITFLGFALIGMIPAFAQTSAFTHTSTNPTGTITNTGTDTMSARLPGFSEVTGIQVVVTKTSGTVSGVSRLYGSIDGVNYIATGDTLALADVAINTAIWTKTLPVYVNYRIRTTGVGTMVATAAATAIQRKP